MSFVDTNIFIRYLTRDDPVKAQACFELFQQAEANEISLTTTEAVIAEVVYVLSSTRLYNLEYGEIRARLYPLLSLKGLRLPDRQTILRALDLYVAYRVDFEDALVVAHMERQKINEVYSYDRAFDRVSEVKRLEP
jgi:predicted nucleic acid-binding protein